MIEEARRPRGRPPSDNCETRKVLLEAAQRLFAHRNFMQVGIRDIAEAAGVSVGSINYHFGSKDGLLEALCDRITPALLEERLIQLRWAQRLEGTRSDRIKAVLHALIEPVLRWNRRPETRMFFTPFLARMRLDGPARVREMMKMEVASLRPFHEALQKLMPHLNDVELGWRLHFALAVEHSLTSEAERLITLTGGEVDFDEVDRMVERAVDFLMYGGFGEVAGAETPFKKQ